jgi:hypothetical protein
MDKIKQSLEWAQKRLELRNCPLTQTQLEVLHFALHEQSKEWVNRKTPHKTSPLNIKEELEKSGRT